MPRKKIHLVPEDFADFLSLISLFGFIAIFLDFALDNPILSQAIIPAFLILGGAGLMYVGKFFSVHKWLGDGVQKDEWAQIFSSVFGIITVLIGVLIWLSIELSDKVTGFAGWVALAPAVFIFLQYLYKSKRRVC